MEEHVGLNPFPLMLFACGRNQEFAQKVAEHLKTNLEETKFREFSDADFILHQKNTIRDRNLFVFCQPGNDKLKYKDLFECFALVAALRQGSPKSWITVIMPYLNFSRQDKPSNLREPILAHMIPTLLQSQGANQIFVCKLHNPASRTVHPMLPMQDIETVPLIVEDIKNRFPDLCPEKYIVNSPDVGAANSCRKVAHMLGLSMVITDKDRDVKNGDTEIINIIGDPGGFIVLTIDDIADTCGTASKGAHAMRSRGAVANHLYTTHPVLSGRAVDTINEAGFESVTFTNSCYVTSQQKQAIKDYREIDVTKLAAQVIANAHNGESIEGLWTPKAH